MLTVESKLDSNSVLNTHRRSRKKREIHPGWPYVIRVSSTSKPPPLFFFFVTYLSFSKLSGLSTPRPLIKPVQLFQAGKGTPFSSFLSHLPPAHLPSPSSSCLPRSSIVQSLHFLKDSIDGLKASRIIKHSVRHTGLRGTAERGGARGQRGRGSGDPPWLVSEAPCRRPS